MRVYPFRGTRYVPGQTDAQTGPQTGLGELAAPPFDQIDDGLRARLHRAEHHFAHLTRPVAGDSESPAAAAAAMHQTWRDRGIVATDRAPGLYPYTIELAAGGRRLGLATLLEIGAAESGTIQPHEQVVSRTIDERLDLLRATRIDLEPVLILADDGGELDRELTGEVAAGPTLAEHRDDAGNRHHLARLTEPSRVERYVSLLAGCNALIADGHHRCEVARRYAAEVEASPGSPASLKLAVLTSLASPGLTIDPIHRALADRADLSPAAGLPAERHSWTGGSGHELAAEVARSERPAIGVWEAGRAPEIWIFDPREGAEGGSALAVTCLHDQVLPGLGLPAAAATDGRVLYRSDPQDLFEAVGSGRLGTGFWLPPMRADAFAAAIADGSLLPPKSTRFLPKLASGLVWATHAEALG